MRINKQSKGKRKKIAFFGNFGQGNLGNESTLQAILYNLRLHLPDAEVTCICTGPEDAAATHNITAIPMHKLFVDPGLLQKNILSRLLRKVFIGIPLELYRWFTAVKTLKNEDMLIVPGTQFLSDNLSRPFGWPYLAFRWSVASKITRCKLLFVSVGVGPLRSPLSRFFVKIAISLADYRSFRDDLSRQYLRRIGFNASDDPVYPDLAFSIPIPAMLRHTTSNTARSVIAVGVKNYQGQYGPKPQYQRASAIYQQYIHNVAACVAWLLKHRHTVCFIIGDVSCDNQVITDLKSLLCEYKLQIDNFTIIDEPIESVEVLFSHLITSDIVVSSRFHNLVLGLLVGKPVISLAYHDKFSELLEGFNLARYNLPIDYLDADIIVERFVEAKNNSEELRQQISRKVEEYRIALVKQYTYIFCDLIQD